MPVKFKVKLIKVSDSVVKCVAAIHAGHWAVFLFSRDQKKLLMPLIRIVKMTFREDAIAAFQKIFDERKERIAAAPGCASVELLRDGNVFFTYSIWEGEAALEAYRNSELFISTWSLVKPLFLTKADAWSVRKVA